MRSVLGDIKHTIMLTQSMNNKFFIFIQDTCPYSPFLLRFLTLGATIKTEIRDYDHSFSQNKLNIIQKIQSPNSFHHVYTMKNRSKFSGAL